MQVATLLVNGRPAVRTRSPAPSSVRVYASPQPAMPTVAKGSRPAQPRTAWQQVTEPRPLRSVMQLDAVHNGREVRRISVDYQQ